MRSSYLVCYDVADDKRLRRVFKLMRGFGDHLQFSVFECQFTASDLVWCREELRKVCVCLSSCWCWSRCLLFCCAWWSSRATAYPADRAGSRPRCWSHKLGDHAALSISLTENLSSILLSIAKTMAANLSFR